MTGSKSHVATPYGFDFVVVNPYHCANFFRQSAHHPQRARRPMFTLVFLQFGATIAATAISAVFFGLHGAISAALAGLVCVVPNALFALRLSLVSRRSGTPPVTAFFVGEFVKLAAIVGLLVLVRAWYEDLHWGALFIGLILTLKANLFAFLVKK